MITAEAGERWLNEFSLKHALDVERLLRAINYAECEARGRMPPAIPYLGCPDEGITLPAEFWPNIIAVLDYSPRHRPPRIGPAQ